MSDSERQEPLLRPSVPSLAWLVAALWAGLALAQRWVWASFIGGGSSAGKLLGIAAVAGIVAAAAMRLRRHAVVLCSAGLCAGVLIGWLYWGHWATEASLFATGGRSTHVVEVLSDETATQFGSSSLCRLVAGPTGGSVVSVEWPKGASVPALGRQVEVTGPQVPLKADSYGLRSAAAGRIGSLRARNVRDVGWATSARGLVGRLRLRAVERMARVSGEAGALLSGVVVGDRRRLAGTQAESDFRTTGLTHLVAVSGSHLVVVAAVVGWVAAALGVGRFSRSALAAAVVGGYVVFSGVQASAVRAWVMALAAALAWASRRRSDGGSALSVAAGVVLVASPPSAFDLGFALSVSAVAGLVLFARFTDAWLAAAVGRRWRAVSSSIALTLTATMATMPITTSTFGVLSLVSPLANAVAGPLVSAALVCGLLGLGAGCVWGVAGDVLLAAAAVPALWAVHAARFMGAWPAAAIPAGGAALPAAVACATAGAALWAWWPRPSPRAARWGVVSACVGVLLLAVGPPVAPGGIVQVLDVGQGDSILVRDGSHAILVDVGPDVRSMRAALSRAGLRRLDAVVITHFHADHYGGLGALKGLIRVPVVFVPAGALASDSSALREARSLVGTDCVREMEAGTGFSVGGLEVDVLWPRGPVADAAVNEASVVLRVAEGEFAALLTGDAEGDVLEPLVADGSVGDLSILKVGHHGSADAVTELQLATLRPEYALVSVGAGNRYGHPTASTVRVLETSGSRVVRTDRCGDITVRIDPSGAYQVKTNRSDAVGGRTVTRAQRGRRIIVCATLDATRHDASSHATHLTESDVQTALRVQAHLPHLRGARSPPGTRTRGAQAQCR